MFTMGVVLHDLTHCIAPQLYGEDPSWPPNATAPTATCSPPLLQIITDQIFAQTDNGELAEALAHFEVPHGAVSSLSSAET